MSYRFTMPSSTHSSPKVHHNTVESLAWLGRSLRTGLVILSLSVPTLNAHAGPKKDPFATDTWHAINTSWPGTIKFDSEKKKVVLQPVGSEKIEASYSFTIDNTASTKKLVKGSLTMVNTLGQVSKSDFVIENDKNLKLAFKNGQNPETYVRMSQAEEAAETKRLESLVKNGTINSNTLKLPPTAEKKH